MYFIDWIIGRLNSISSLFYSIYLEVYYWIYPFNLAASFFYSLTTVFNNFAWDMYYFGQWVDTTASKLLEILSWSTVQSYVLSWIPNLEPIRDWFYTWIDNITAIVANWWEVTKLTVQSWIDEAKALLQLQIDNLMGLWFNLQVAWDEFKGRIPSIDEILTWFTDWWGKILTQIVAWGALTALQIQGLIDSAFLLRQSYWEGWQDIRDSVFEFFTDPLGWLEARFTDWFLGPEE